MQLARVLVLLAAAGTASAGPIARFPLLSKAEQARAATALRASFPAAWQPRVTVDEVGMPDEIELEVPSPIDDAHAVERVLAIVRDHARAFGVLDPAALHGVQEYSDVHVGEGARWTGNIFAHYEGRRLTLRGHLWPLDTPEPPAVDRDRLLRPWIGLHGTAPSRCECRREDPVVTARDSFEVDVGAALVCRDHVLVPRLAIAIEARLGSATVPGLDKMPRLLDARTREPIGEDFLMPPAGAGTTYPDETGSVQARLTAACFYR